MRFDGNSEEMREATLADLGERLREASSAQALRWGVGERRRRPGWLERREGMSSVREGAGLGDMKPLLLLLPIVKDNFFS